MQKVFSPRNVLYAVIVLAMMATATTSFAQIRISVGFGPPALPVYAQPVCPGDGYMWTPGYWAWDPDFGDYYWVPGTWILAPEVGWWWTPPYWGWENGAWLFYGGYWGPRVGWYGGINYGFGYFGTGFVGGRWDGGHFFYNRAVVNINVRDVHNVYNEKITNITVNHVSYNGGPGGIDARPRAGEDVPENERHGLVAAQTQHLIAARANPQLRASANHGKPPIAATPRATEFSGHGVVHAKEAGGAYNPPPANRGELRGAVHPNQLQQPERVTPNTGDENRNREYQQEQDKLLSQQNNERQQLQHQQEQEHEQMARQNANEQQRQQMETRHQQQTQQMAQRQIQQRQNLQQRYSPPAPRGGGRR